MSDKYKTHKPNKETYIQLKEAQDYLFSSVRNYAELPVLLDIVLETTQLKIYV